MAPSSQYPNLDDPIRRLLDIGQLFSARARDDYHLTTMRQLRDLMRSQTKAQNRTFLAQWLENPRRMECVPPPKFRRNYSVRPFNEYAYQSVIRYMTRHVHAERLPAPLRTRALRISHPRRCRET